MRGSQTLFVTALVCASGLGGHERSSVDLIRGNGRPNPALESDAMRAEEPDLSMALHSQIKELAELAGLRPQQAAASSGVCSPRHLGKRYCPWTVSCTFCNLPLVRNSGPLWQAYLRCKY